MPVVTCIRNQDFVDVQAHVVGTKQTMLELYRNSPEYECVDESPRASQALYTENV